MSEPNYQGIALNNAAVMGDFSKVLAERNEEIKQLKEAQRWRDVKEELPESFDLVLAIDEDKHVKIVSVDIGFAFAFTHWLPMPELRKELEEVR
tara:strand:- start:297 stop:578 length:282 start_codon:yes stop_codon:yes gene_type:complete